MSIETNLNISSSFLAKVTVRSDSFKCPMMVQRFGKIVIHRPLYCLFAYFMK